MGADLDCRMAIGHVQERSVMKRRVCLLTGAAGRLGRAFVAAYWDTYDFAALYHNTIPRFEIRPRLFEPIQVATKASPLGSAPYVVRGDLGSEEDLDRVARTVLSRFGSIDLLVNAAVVYRFGPATAREGLRDVSPQLDVNLLAPVRLALLLLDMSWRETPAENRRRNRNIVNVSSTSGLRLYPGSDQMMYAATKSALNMASLYMADEFAKFGIRVNALCPDSFPAQVPTEYVLKRICALDCGSELGKIEPLWGPMQSPAVR